MLSFILMNPTPYSYWQPQPQLKDLKIINLFLTQFIGLTLSQVVAHGWIQIVITFKPQQLWTWNFEYLANFYIGCFW